MNGREHEDTAPRTYVLVWLALLALLGLTLGGAYAHLGAIDTPLHLVIALTQAALVLLFSMHLRFAHPLLRVFALIGVFCIVILIIMTLSDTLTR